MFGSEKHDLITASADNEVEVAQYVTSTPLAPLAHDERRLEI